MFHLARHPDLLELSPNQLAEQLGIHPNQAHTILASPAVYERLVSAILQNTIKPHKHGEILETIAAEIHNPEQPLGYRIAAAKFVAQQTGVLQATKTAHQEEKVFRVVLEHNPHAKEVADVFDASTRLVPSVDAEDATYTELPSGDGSPHKDLSHEDAGGS